MPAPPAAAPGAQTLARGIAVLKRVAASPDGLAVNEIADMVGVHRTVAYRLLQTLSDAELVTRGADGRYRASVGLLALTASGLAALRDLARPILQEASDALGATVALFVEEGDSAVALSVVTPRSAIYKIVYPDGSRFPLNKAAGGLALLSLHAPRPDDPPTLAAVREQGWARTFSELEPNAHGVAVPIAPSGGRPLACVNVITYSADVAERALPALVEAAAALEKATGG